MTVFDVKGQMVEIGPGVAGTEVEATVSGQGGKGVFVYAFCFEDCTSYSVSEKSWYGTAKDGAFDESDCTEHYDDLDSTTGSAYHDVFVVLDKVMRLIEGN